jgi:hypothetical protein
MRNVLRKYFFYKRRDITYDYDEDEDLMNPDSTFNATLSILLMFGTLAFVVFFFYL